MGVIHDFGNVDEILADPAPGTALFTKIIGDDEPERYNFRIDWGRGTNNANAQPGATPMVRVQMEAGEHVTDKFEPAFHIEIGEGWVSLLPEATDGVYIGIESDRSQINFTSPTKVFDISDSSGQKEVPAPESAAEWVSWFQKHPNLYVSKSVPVSLGGAPGMQIDVTATSTPENYPQYCGGQPCVPLFPTGGTPIVSFASHVGLKERFIIVDVNGKPVIVDVSAPADRFEAFLPKAQKVLDTIEWKDA